MNGRLRNQHLPLISQPWFIAVSFFVVSSLIFAAVHLAYFSNQKNDHAAMLVLHESSAYVSAVESYQRMSNLVVNVLLKDDALVDLMAKASQSGTQAQLEIRQELVTLLLPRLKRLEQNDVKRIQFHLANGLNYFSFDSFVILHPPVMDERKTLQSVLVSGKRAHGFEVTDGSSGFRYVYPLSQHDQVVGSIELIYDLSEFSNLFVKPTLLAESLLIKHSATGLSLLNLIGSSSPFGREWRLDDKLFTYASGLDKMTIEAINKQVAGSIKQLSSGAQAFFADVNGVKYALTAFPLKDSQGRVVAYSLKYHQDLATLAIQNNAFKFSLFREVFLALFSLTVFLYLSRYQKNLDSLQKVASTDTLTLIHNRAELEKNLPLLIEEYSKSDRALSLIFMDIDNFKLLNDNYGHLVGDEILIALSALVKQQLRSNDLFVRWGGEEFIICLPNASFSKAEFVAEKLRHEIETTPLTAKNINVTSSFGVTTLNESDNEFSFISRADAQLYAAKKAGRNQVCSFEV